MNNDKNKVKNILLGALSGLVTDMIDSFKIGKRNKRGYKEDGRQSNL